MIGLLNGTCQLIGSGEAIIDVGGVGYLLTCGTRTLSALSVGEGASIHVETHVRETAITLYGFISDEERAWFVRLQSVQGVGPKAALAILDIMTPGEVLSAANLEDKTAFARASGVGPKLATRIATELSGKGPPAGRGFYPEFRQTGTSPQPMTAMPRQGLQKDAASALVNLGIGESDALKAVALAHQSFADEPALDDLIRVALKELGG